MQRISGQNGGIPDHAIASSRRLRSMVRNIVQYKFSLDVLFSYSDVELHCVHTIAWLGYPFLWRNLGASFHRYVMKGCCFYCRGNRSEFLVAEENPQTCAFRDLGVQQGSF